MPLVLLLPWLLTLGWAGSGEGMGDTGGSEDGDGYSETEGDCDDGNHHGVLAANASWRSEVVPRPPHPSPTAPGIA
jgi:hypothetical protein